ncbi:DCC1-like thiol-disulfide oxidoreductase family protein [Methylobacterium marchantiae]|uniref:DCC1-like thiol-disulfide oxidoreductase family protein n=1 Tax=Methylobacterium marchantiae TaxID=600331 RepID=A0ABW3WY31_9HYPH
MVPPFAEDRPIVVFDGHCALCVGRIRFVMRCDRDRRFRFLPAQSALG